MEKEIKKCKGFVGPTCCVLCLRRDYEYNVRLVKKLAIDPDNGQEYCNYYVGNKSKALRE